MEPVLMFEKNVLASTTTPPVAVVVNVYVWTAPEVPMVPATVRAVPSCANPAHVEAGCWFGMAPTLEVRIDRSFSGLVAPG